MELNKNDHEDRMDYCRKELVSRIKGILVEDGIREIFPGVILARSSQSSHPMHTVYKPSFCVIAQGRKDVYLGNDCFTYDAGKFLIATVGVPVVSRLINASKEEPYLTMIVEFCPRTVAELMMESIETDKTGSNSVKALDIGKVDANMIDAVLRMIRLNETPDDVESILPLIKKELIYRLLKSDQKARMMHIVAGDEQKKISQAIDNLRVNYDKSFRVNELARDIGMSVSGFHQHFKSVTSMSPLQFQKAIRLQEARRLMLEENLDAAIAGYKVGYEDASYFSRDYKKHFGAPPQRDISNLKAS